MEKLEVDDQFKLPYGLGFDKLIKKRTDMVDRDKLQNNRVMDELVEKLGYMDYRDALACNKYLIDVKRHGDYHQQARAKILTVALSRYNAQRRQQIEQKALAKSPSDKDEAKLKVIMDEDPEMAKLYREAYGDIKADKEADYNEALRIHEKYAYQVEGKHRVEGSKFDLSQEKKTPVEIAAMETHEVPIERTVAKVASGASRKAQVRRIAPGTDSHSRRTPPRPPDTASGVAPDFIRAAQA